MKNLKLDKIHLDQLSESDRALKNWENKIPLNRDGRRNQLKRYKVYLELHKTENTWSVYAVDKKKHKELVDSSSNYEEKEEPMLFDPTNPDHMDDDDDNDDMVMVEEEETTSEDTV